MTKEGWGFLSNAKKEHYFVDGVSLCGKWMHKGDVDSTTGARTPDDCAICFKRLTKRLARKIP
jgi:hypothetical protein